MTFNTELWNTQTPGAGGYEIERSLRFNGNADSSYLSRTPASAGNRKTWTWAGWVKRSKLTINQWIFSAASGPTADRNNFLFNTDDKLVVGFNISGTWTNSITDAVFRDVSAWYHIVVALDTTQSTDSNRTKIYVNGVQQTLTGTYPAQNADTPINDTVAHSLGRYEAGSSDYFNGYLADVHFIDGQALDPTSFGEFDDNGVWQPIAYTFGTNPNNGTTWATATYLSSTSNYPGYPVANGFDGSTSTEWLENTTGGTVTFSNISIPYSSTVKIWVGGSGATVSVNGGAGQSISNGSWVTVASGSGTLTSLAWTANGSEYPALIGIQIDGYTLISGADDNSFHLDFSDNSSVAALGYDAAGSNDWTVNNISGLFYSGTALFNASLNATPFSDATGNETITNNGSITTSAAGTNSFNISNAGDFGGSTQWLLVTEVTIPTNYTIDYYYKSTNATQTGNATVIDSNGEVFIRDYGSATSRKIRLNDGSATDYSYTITNNTWNHVRVTNTGIWVNGTSINSSPKNIAGRSSKITIGSYNNAGGYQFDGLIGPIRILDANLGAPTAGGEPTDSGSLPNTETTSSSTGAGNDSLRDSPMNGDTANDTGAGGEIPGNYATWNPLNTSTYTFVNGNLEGTGYAPTNQMTSTIGVSSGKWYAEFVASGSGGQNSIMIGISRGEEGYFPGQLSTSYGYIAGDGKLYNNQVPASYGATYTYGDVIGVALDLDNGTLTYYKNNISQGQAATGLSGTYVFAARNASSTGDKLVANFGQRAFAYSAPSGFKALCTANLDTPTIEDGSTAMDVVTYSGNSGTQSITGLQISPDLVWLKGRSQADRHYLFDTVRGKNAVLASNETTSETDYSSLYPNYLQSFNSDGFTLGYYAAQGGLNKSGETYVAWTWDAGSSTVSNTDGSITSQVRANASAGFSVVTYTGTGNNATVGHGLSSSPSFYIVKRRNAANDWECYHSALGATYYGKLNKLDVWTTAGGTLRWNDTEPTSSVFSVGTSANVNDGAGTYVAYCFAPIANYSAFGSFTGNGLGSPNGPFIYTGFRPRWILFKNTNTGNGWRIMDSSVNPYNVVSTGVYPYLSNSEDSATNWQVDYLSNGFKVRSNSGQTEINGSGNTIIYAAFAEHPQKYSRAR